MKLNFRHCEEAELIRHYERVQLIRHCEGAKRPKQSSAGLLRRLRRLAMTEILCSLAMTVLVFTAGAAVAAEPVNRAVFADFNNGTLINALGGESGSWELDPADKEQFSKASIDYINDQRKKGCLKLEYDVDSSKKAVNGFWTKLSHFDARAFDHFEFWVKGDKDKGYTTTFKIEIKKLKKENGRQTSDSVKGNFIVTGITDEWQKISIPLHSIVGIEETWQDWSGLEDFVIAFESRRADKKTGIIYIDDIAFIRTGDPGPSIRDEIPRKPKTKGWMAGEQFARFLIERLSGFPKEVHVKKQFPEDNKAFLMAIARDTWRYFDEVVDKEYALPLDNIKLGKDKAISDETVVGDYTNVTNIGLYLICLVSAYDLGFISKEEAVKRIGLTLDSIEKLESYRGFLYNYYDVTVFQRTTHFISFVDSGWLTVGLIVAKNAFPEALEKRCQKLIDARDFSFFYDPVEGHMHHGYYVNVGSYSTYHYGIFYTEPRAISYMAIGKGDVPMEHWFMLNRTFPESWAWQTQIPKDRKTKEYFGYKTKSGYYSYGDYKFVPSWGGSLFEALMPTLIIDEKALAPKGLGLNDKLHTEIHMKYALGELGYKVWGMSTCSVPGGGYSEYGVNALGIKGYKAGVVTPHATFLALEFAPKEAIGNLRALLKEYNIYGEYGFYDSVDVGTGAVATKYLCLDQAMSFIAINNFLNDGAIRRRFRKDKINLEVEKLLSCENFFN